MTRRLGLAAIAAIVAGAGCAEQSGSATSGVPMSTAVPAERGGVASWVGSQESPGMDQSWAGPQISPGMDASWVGRQESPGMDQSWASPQITVTPRAVAATTPSTGVIPESSTALTMSSSVPPSVPVGADASFVAATPEVAAVMTAAIGRTEAAYDAAVRDPSNAALRDVLAATTLDDSAAEQLFLSWYDHVIAEGYTYVAPVDGENTTTLMPGAVISVDTTGRLAIAQVCAASGDTIIGPDTSGTEVIVASGWSADEQAQVFTLDATEAEWLLTEIVDLESHPGVRTCGESPSSSVPSASSPGP